MCTGQDMAPLRATEGGLVAGDCIAGHRLPRSNLFSLMPNLRVHNVCNAEASNYLSLAGELKAPHMKYARDAPNRAEHAGASGAGTLCYLPWVFGANGKVRA